MKSGGIIASAAVLMIAAGLIHLVIAPLHWAHSPAHGWFHLLSGGAEIVWGVLFWRKPSMVLCRTGMVMAGSLIVLWLITRVLPAPFTHEPEEMEGFGILSKLSEAMGIAALVFAIVSKAISSGSRFSVWRIVGAVAVTAILAGGFVYTLGIAIEPLFPGWGEETAPAVAASGDSARANADELQVVTGGIAQPYTGGDAISVAGEVMASLTLAPGDARHSRRADVLLYRRTPAEPVNDATIQATAHMRYMDHGTFRVVALASDDGHYVLPLAFPMPGEWELDLEITADNTNSAIHLDVNLVDGE
jgi:hypothetical protein